MTKLKSCELDLETVALSSAPFSWHADKGLMVCEASDLRGSFRLHRLYNDACDVGIAIRSKRTGNVERFVLAKVDESGGDVAGWNFVPVNPKCGVRRVLIIND